MNAELQMLLRAIRGPLMLIVVGVMFAADHFWDLPAQRTWPVLIICLGLWKLVEYMASRPVTPEPPAGGV